MCIVRNLTSTSTFGITFQRGLRSGVQLSSWSYTRVRTMLSRLVTGYLSLVEK